jgi:hypothetical protein
MGPIYCSVTATVSYQPALRKIPEVRKSVVLLSYHLTYNAFCNDKLQQGMLCFSCFKHKNLHMEVKLSTLFTPPRSSNVDVSFMFRLTVNPVKGLLYSWVQDYMKQHQNKSMSTLWPFILLKKIILTNYHKKLRINQ